jgi:hypothetical protein
MSGIVSAIAAILLMLDAPSGQTLEPQVQGARQAVGLFARTCLRYPNNTAAIRSFMVDHHAPELNAEGRAIFLKGRSGVGFDATNQFARLAVVSEDNGTCSVFAEKADAIELASLIDAAFRKLNIEVTSQREVNTGRGHAHIYNLVINSLPFMFAWSTNADQAGAIQAAITLAPKA